MTTTSPTNAQENSAQPHGGTNDSLGMGVWRVENDRDTCYIVGTFEQLNAFADNHQHADKLSVNFKVKPTNAGNGLDGPALATVGSDTFPSHLTEAHLELVHGEVPGLLQWPDFAEQSILLYSSRDEHVLHCAAWPNRK